MEKFIARQVLFIAKVVGLALVQYLFVFLYDSYRYSKFENWEGPHDPLSMNECFYSAKEAERPFSPILEKKVDLPSATVKKKGQLSAIEKFDLLPDEKPKESWSLPLEQPDSVYWKCAFKKAKQIADKYFFPSIYWMLSISYIYMILDWVYKNK